MTYKMKAVALVAVAGFAAPLAFFGRGQASDHADTPELAANGGLDITDVYVFPSNQDPTRVALVMNVHPLVAKGAGLSTYFDPNVLYQIKIDNTGDAVEDLVIQARFGAAAPGQTVAIAGPVAPSTTGTANVEEPRFPTTGVINTAFVPVKGTRVFAGGREDPFFFDLEQFFNILPDRASPLFGPYDGDPNKPLLGSWRPAGQAVDFLSNGSYNVLSIVVEVPRTLLYSTTGGKVISVWTTTNSAQGSTWTQRDRLARPVVNEVLATVAHDRHKINDEAAPADDALELRYDILNFMTYPATRSAAIREVAAAVLVPDVIKADLNEFDGASYLGYETGGATGAKFGGRKLLDDVVDISLGAVFGSTFSDLGLAPDDGKEIPSLTSDNVDASGKHFRPNFPYLGNPR